MANLDNLFVDYKPSHLTTTAVCHGGHNILYEKFAEFKNEWNLFQNKFCDLHNQIASVAYSFGMIKVVL